MFQTILICIASLSATKPPAPAELQPAVATASIDGLEDAIVTIPEKARVQFKRVATASGTRIRLTINDVTIDVTKAQIRLDNRITKLWLDKDGTMWMDSMTVPEAPAPRPAAPR